MKVQSYLILDLGIFIEVKHKAVPRTKPKFAMLDPNTLEIAMSDDPFKAELILINNSGAEVAKETTVRPMTTFDKFNFIERSTADLRR